MPEEIEEKKEFLRREEIKTMTKDVSKLREAEAQKERERMAVLKTEEEARKERERVRKEAEERKKIEEAKRKAEEARKKEEILKKVEEEKPAEEVAHLPKKLSFFEKVFFRVALIIILFLIFALLITFWYWYFKTGKAPMEEVLKKEIISEEIPKKEELLPEIIIPPPLISIEETKNIEVSKTEEIPLFLNQLLSEELKPSVFTRVLIKNLKENKVVNLEEFLNSFQVLTPENFEQKLDTDFTLFVYSQKEEKRIGFLVKIKEKEGLLALLKSWEGSMEKDFESLFLLMGKAQPALISYFRDGNYKEKTFRFQTFSRADFGIVYSAIDDLFVFTSSWESMKEIIDKLSQ